MRRLALAIVAAAFCPLTTNAANAAIIAAERTATVSSTITPQARGASRRERFRASAKTGEEKWQLQGARKLSKSGKSGSGKSGKSGGGGDQTGQDVIVIYIPTPPQQT